MDYIIRRVILAIFVTCLWPNFALWVAVVLFCTKILWNLGVPYELLRRNLIKKESKGGISLNPLVETGLLLIALIVSLFAQGTTWINSPKNIAIGGCLLIIGSYVHLILVGAFCGWLATKIKKTKEGKGGLSL